MKILSVIKFSRFFIALFLLMTVFPIMGMLLWNGDNLAQMNVAQHKQFLEMISYEVTWQVEHYLTNDLKNTERISHSLSEHFLSLEDYRVLYEARKVVYLRNPRVSNYLKSRCGSNLLKNYDGHSVTGDYCTNGQQIETVYLLPVLQSTGALLLFKPVPFGLLVPQGPHVAEFYPGTDVKPSSRIGFIDSGPFHMSHERHPRTFLPLTSLMNFLHLATAPPQPGKDEEPPPLPADEKDASFLKDKGLSPQPLSSDYINIPVKNQSGGIVATIILRMRERPSPSAESQEWMGILILLTGLVTSLIAGFYVHRNFIAPLIRLSLLIQEVQQGDLSVRMEIGRINQPEVLKTLEGFNDMLGQLGEKERLRNNFISNLTHDFRTPLIAQTRTLDLLLRDFSEAGLTQPAQLLASLIKNNQHLLGMVNQLLETYQFESGKLHLNFAPVDMPLLVDQCFETVLALAASRHIILENDFPEAFPLVEADVRCMSRVFINLLGNAIENTPKGTRIVVSGKQLTDQEVAFHFRDNGQGISEEEQAHLFDRYYAGTNDTRKLGSGLGLYICKMFVEAHHGTICVESVPGRFTDFIIRLPIKTVRATTV